MVGGNGRDEDAPHVARHADMWNGFGTPDELAHEVDGVLRGHCDDVGRDEREIERTWATSGSTIRDSAEEAAAVWRATMAHNTTTPEAEADRTPASRAAGSSAERLRAYVAAGFGTTIVEVSRHRTTSRPWSGSSAR